MAELLVEQQHQVAILTFNRPSKHNALNESLLYALQNALEQALADPQIRVIVLKAKGKHFSAGADLSWMQNMVDYSEEENIKDALILARVLHTLHNSTKPTIAMIQGTAFGGGVGLVAACDIAIAADSAQFCFSEVKLGLVPAVISPYVIKAIGERAAKWLFMTAEMFDAPRAQALQLIHYCIAEQELEPYTLSYAEKISQLAPQAVSDCKTLIASVLGKTINEQLLLDTATIIAKKRISPEGQIGLKAFFKKEPPIWD